MTDDCTLTNTSVDYNISPKSTSDFVEFQAEWMDGWMTRFNVVFKCISIISGR